GVGVEVDAAVARDHAVEARARLHVALRDHQVGHVERLHAEAEAAGQLAPAADAAAEQDEGVVDVDQDQVGGVDDRAVQPAPAAERDFALRAADDAAA